MVFSSLIFLFWFLPMVLLFYFMVEAKYRNWILLFFSLFFYGWGEGEMLIIMLFSACINFIFGMLIEQKESEGSRKWVLFLGIILNLSLLLFYKYGNFFTDNYNLLAHYFKIDPIIGDKIILPLGISFYTFHGMSYMIDVYRKHTPAQRNPLKLALYISFFPQLIAGPIVRYKDIESQMNERSIDLELFASGIKRFIIGLAKKVLLANIIGRIPAMVFKLPESELNAYWSWLSIIAATLQVYLDFSGYSDMAIGLARMFGFKFKENFIYPFFSQSMKEFWTRWHISLSTWFKDYVYIPLGGSKNGKIRMYLNLWIVFLLTGFWHGASWSFILFGAFHGLLIVLERLGLSKVLEFLPRMFRSVYVFMITAFSIIFFSIDDLTHIKHFYLSLFKFVSPDSFSRLNLYLTTEYYITLIVALFVSFPFVEYLFGKIKKEKIRNRIELAGIVLIFLLSIGELMNSTFNPFIYFRF
jgi:alginate O-acetyltransferase complex protein AlgI